MSDDPVTALVVWFYEQLWNRWDDSAVDHTLAAEFTFRGAPAVHRHAWVLGDLDTLRSHLAGDPS